MSQEPENEIPSEELLVHGRAKRATAGNRMQFLMQHLEDEDVRNDLLAEDETDQLDYQLSDAEDVAFGSSDDSDDEGPPREGQDEDLQGEKELQKAERVEARKKKRKAHDFANMPLNPLMKRQRLAASNSLLAPRPRKKSERISWLPTLDDAPTRQSRRRQTVANKEQTEAKLKESQKRSEKAHELMKIAAEKKAAAAVPALTQEDRMKRALKVEKENSRTLNRWEKAEEERQLAQQQRLEALRDRQLEGPVFRYWSGSVMWEGEKIKVKRVHQPRVEAVVESKPKPVAEVPSTETPTQPIANEADERPNPTNPQDVKSTDESGGQPTEDTLMVDATTEPPIAADQASKNIPTTERDREISPKAALETTEQTAPAVVEGNETSLDKLSHDKETETEKKPLGDKSVEEKPSEQSSARPTPAPEQKSPSFLDGIHYWASQSPEATAQKNKTPSSQTPVPASAPQSEAQEPASVPLQTEQVVVADQPGQEATTDTSQPSTLQPPTSRPVDATQSVDTIQPSEATPQSTAPFDIYPQVQSESAPQPPSIPLIREQAQRTLIILEAFPTLELAPPTLPSSKKSTTTSSLLTSILLPSALPTLTPQESKYLTSKSAKKREFLPPPPPKPVCAITAKPARFRDPKTAVAYQGLDAYKALQRVAAGGCRWGGQGWDCWMGIVGEGVMGRVARGVPECFVSGKVVRMEVLKKEDVKVEDGVKEKTAVAPVAPVAAGSTPAPATSGGLPAGAAP
ncbi:YL1-domain-containing protein [Aureobasidium subglaciale]|nr:YL1-domain-containing protein [Aureobasidium subglaciale]KAI5222484.1 YL1-domain-containing protein [Aureobasidium subglaciale]KAI5223299.1 YL1-domain-containing protein [Aureobasidium subglaciale]KAI5259939.1 YL1-domain-containing protein [Aureobasidium subglaciale]